MIDLDVVIAQFGDILETIAEQATCLRCRRLLPRESAE